MRYRAGLEAKVCHRVPLILVFGAALAKVSEHLRRVVYYFDWKGSPTIIWVRGCRVRPWWSRRTGLLYLNRQRILLLEMWPYTVLPREKPIFMEWLVNGLPCEIQGSKQWLKV